MKHETLLFSFLPWECAKNRSHHLANHLQRSTPLFWVEPVGNRLSPGGGIPLQSDIPNPPTILTLPRGLAGRNYAPIHHLASLYWAWWLRPRLHAWRTPGVPLVILVQTPAAWDVARRLPHDLLVYDAHDAWHLIPPNRARLINRIERAAARAANLVLTSSASLATRMRLYGAMPFDLPNACDPGAWHSSPTPSEPDLLRDVPHPRFLFFGGIDDAFDLDALTAAVTAMPDAGWILLGEGSHALALCERLKPFPHVHMPGTVPYAQLPAFAAHADACLLPYRLTERNDARDTIKLYEYLASGLPIVSNPIAQTRRFPELLALNADKTPSGFAAACARALSMTTPVERDARLAAAREHSWEERCRTLLRLISETMGRCP